MSKKSRNGLVDASGMLLPEVVRAETPVSAKMACDMFMPPAKMDDIGNWRGRGLMVGKQAAKKRIRLGWFKRGGRVYTTEEEVMRFAHATHQILSGFIPSKAIRK